MPFAHEIASHTSDQWRRRLRELATTFERAASLELGADIAVLAWERATLVIELITMTYSEINYR